MRNLRTVLQAIIDIVPPEIHGRARLERYRDDEYPRAPEDSGFQYAAGLVYSVVINPSGDGRTKLGLISLPWTIPSTEMWRAHAMAIWLDRPLDALIAEGVIAIETPQEKKPSAFDVVRSYCGKRGWVVKESEESKFSSYLGSVSGQANNASNGMVEIYRTEDGTVQFQPMMLESSGVEAAETAYKTFRQRSVPMAAELASLDYSGHEWPSASGQDVPF